MVALPEYLFLSENDAPPEGVAQAAAIHRLPREPRYDGFSPPEGDTI
jgi:hypothetical protein